MRISDWSSDVCSSDLGHVAVISRIVDARVAMVTHANWSRIDGERGHAEQDVTLYDVSPGNDWSQVRVWYRDMDGLGGSTYPVSGFIYPAPAGDAPATVHKARPAAALTGPAPPFIAPPPHAPPHNQTP